jgi:hypothetical protein
MFVEWSNMSCLLVPVSVIVIGHHIDPVKILSNTGDIITNINNLLAWRDSSRQKKASWSECSFQLRNKSSKRSLIFVSFLLALSLENMMGAIKIIMFGINIPASSWGTPSPGPDHQSCIFQ